MLALLLAIVTYTIDNKSSVTASGDVPSETTANYVCTYQKGSVTAGNSATLTLANWENYELEQVTVYMKSNKASGAGTLTLMADNELKWSASGAFNSRAWAGVYTTEFVPISHSWTQPWSADTIRITITASENSLHISHYELQYKSKPVLPRQVSFCTYVDTMLCPMTETTANQGILLPDLPWQHEDWYFVGWTTNPIDQSTECPTYMPPGMRYFPQRDITLYALYSNQMSTQWIQADTILTGSYLFTLPILNLQSYGDANGGYLQVESSFVKKLQLTDTYYCYIYTSRDIYDDQVYDLQVLTDSTLYIRNHHTGIPLGYKQKKLSSVLSEWKYRIYPNHSIAFYFTENGYDYLLRLATTGDKMGVEKVSQPLSEWPDNSMFIFNTEDAAQEALWSSYPLMHLPLNQTHATNHSYYDIPIGNWILRIINNQKYLLIQH